MLFLIKIFFQIGYYLIQKILHYFLFFIFQIFRSKQYFNQLIFIYRQIKINFLFLIQFESIFTIYLNFINRIFFY
jgi:hypothetical protein